MSSKWLAALNALGDLSGERNSVKAATQNFRWRYFELVKSPSEGEDEEIYTDVQRRIEGKMLNIKNNYSTDNIQEMNTIIQSKIERLRNAAYLQEKQLFEDITKGKNILANYETLTNKSKELIKGRVHQLDEHNMGNPLDNSITFWTNYVYFQDFQKQHIRDFTPKQAYSLALSSENINKYLYKEGMEEIFSRHLALAGNDKALSQLSDKISIEAINVLDQEYSNWAALQSDDAIREALLEAMSSILSDYTVIRNGKRIFKGIKRGGIRIKDSSASYFSSQVRDRLSEELQKIEDNYNKQHPGGEIDLTVDLKNKSGKTFFLVYPQSNAKTQTRISQYQSSLAGDDFDGRILATIQALSDAIQEMWNNKEGQSEEKNKQLSLKGIGYLMTNDDFYQNALQYSQSKELQQYIFTAAKTLEQKKSFKSINANQYIAGILGELSGSLHFSQVASEAVKMTGSTQSLSGTGGSPNDLIAQFGDFRTGINVKRWMSYDNMLPLYTDSKSISIYSRTMQKYVGTADQWLLKFIHANEGFFPTDGQALAEKISQVIIGKNISNFLRVSDAYKRTATNYFYLINNVIYPLSYIYDCVLVLMDKETKGSLYDLFFQDNFKNIPVKTYNTLSNARRYWNEDNYRLNKAKNGGGDQRVRFKGLNVNLVSFNLF